MSTPGLQLPRGEPSMDQGHIVLAADWPEETYPTAFKNAAGSAAAEVVLPSALIAYPSLKGAGEVYWLIVGEYRNSTGGNTTLTFRLKSKAASSPYTEATLFTLAPSTIASAAFTANGSFELEVWLRPYAQVTFGTWRQWITTKLTIRPELSSADQVLVARSRTTIDFGADLELFWTVAKNATNNEEVAVQGFTCIQRVPRSGA